MSQYSIKTEILAEKIDWIAYTQKTDSEWCFPAYIDNHWKKISPLRNYTSGEENKQGIKRFWNTINPYQGKQVLLSGTASSMLGENTENFLRWVSSQGWKPTRLDYSLDILHSNFNLRVIVPQLRERKVITHARQIPRYTDEWKQGFTQYIGTKTSETYTKVYDKAVEQKANHPWVRIETTYQGDRAEASLQAYLQCGSTRPLIKRHVHFPEWRAWNRVMSSAVVKLIAPTRETRTRAWLLSQVAKSIAREIAMDDDQQFLFQMIGRIREEYTIITKGKVEVDW